MEVFFTWCATIAGVLFLGQFVLGLLGLVEDAGLDGIGGHDVADLAHDGHFDHAGGAFAGFLSFRAVTAAVTVFGLAGLAATRRLADPGHAMLIAVASGAAVLVAVGYLLRGLYGLNASGSVDERQAVGEAGSVYLSVPANGSGQGKVTLELQGRTVELRAVSEGETLPPGTTVVITRFLSPGVVEVARIPNTVPEGQPHV